MTTARRMPPMQLRLPLLIAAWLICGASVVHGADATTVETAPIQPAAAPAPAIAGSRAGDYVGQEVTIEGRVTAIHESPLATVVGFAPNFAGFTATILAGDRDKFPSDLATRVRDRLVRVSGTVTAYRGKPEMALRDPSQLVMAPPPGPGSVAAYAAPVPVATPDGSLQDIRRALARIETRLESLESRLNTLEQTEPVPDEIAPEPRPGR
jgi:hypothetical protein